MDGWRRRHPADTPPDDVPFALTAEDRHGPVLLALNPGAHTASVRIGQRVTDARAICPELRIAPSEPEADTRTLRDLALWATRWSPFTVVDGTDGLFLDLTGVAHLWNGEDALAGNILRRFREFGLRAQLAIAPTPGAAWGLARYGGRRAVSVKPEDVDRALAPLPVESLRLDPEIVLLLRRLGLKHVGDLAAVPRLALGRRFTSTEPARNPLLRLLQATGTLHEPLAPEVPDPPPRVLRRVTEPITHLPLLQIMLGDMAAALGHELERRGVGLRRLRFDGYRVDGGTEAVEVETSRAVREPGHLIRLFDGKLDRLDAGFGFDAAALTAMRTEPLGHAQTDLVEAEPGESRLSRLLDRLAAKLGPARVRRPVLVESHVPERNVAWASALDERTKAQSSHGAIRRPLRLLDRPEAIEVIYATPEGAPRQFKWRRQAHRIARVEGPERIGPEWWRERSTARARDYYRVEDEAGRRYWIYRDGRHGDGREAALGWFLHGLFA